MRHACVLMAVLVAVSGCSSISVQRDYDRSVDFSTLKTYAWKHEVQPKTGNPRVDNDLLDERIRTAVESNLGTKGFVAEDASGADFLVAYFVQYKRRISGNTWAFGIGSGFYDGYGGGVGINTAISDYDEGYLTIDIISRASGKTIWRGVGRRATYDASKPEKTTEIVHSAVTRILKDFPPKK